jgi:glycosyltransferase involved in cell wall biosynthesis
MRFKRKSKFNRIYKMINLLIEGWFNIPHSYANVVCFEMYAMHKRYSNEINFYICEKEYFSPNWKKTMVLPEHYRKVLFDTSVFKPYKNEKIDLIYRVVFPYDISINNNNMNIPKCVFYTSEYAIVPSDYFMSTKGRFSDMSVLKKYLSTFRKNLYFTCPSKWSSLGLDKIDESYTNENKNRIITHGVDTTVFYKDPEGRNRVRTKYGIKDNEVLLMNISALTGNKGIIFIMITLAILVKNGFTNTKLLIKGIADLYQTTNVIQGYFNQLSNYVSKEECENLIKNNIVITYDTLTFEQMKDLYNACDLYISPYIAEGFNLTPLEALACGCNVVVSSTGSTEKYINDIYDNGGKDFVHRLNSKVITDADNKSFNEINVNDLINLVYNFVRIHQVDKDHSKMLEYIEKEYSWNKVTELKVDYFKEIIKASNAL